MAWEQLAMQNVNGKMKKFVQLRDPYATFRSTYDKEGKLVDDSHEITATTGAGMDNMGTFNLEPVDFQKMFNSFAGIPESAKTVFTAKMNACRNYFKDPLSPEEMEACKLPDAPTLQQFETICNKFRNAAEKASAYTEKKLSEINERCERFRNNQDVPHDNKTVEQMQSFSEVITNYIAKESETDQ